MCGMVSQRSDPRRAKDVEHAFLDSLIDLLERHDLVDRAGLDRFGVHAEDYGRGFVLCDHVSAGSFDGLYATHAVIPHAGEDDPDTHVARIVGSSLKGNVGARTISVDPRPFIESDAAGLRNL